MSSAEEVDIRLVRDAGLKTSGAQHRHCAGGGRFNPQHERRKFPQDKAGRVRLL